MIGKIFGHYRIVERIGAGGMGVVYRAHDERLARDVALKFPPADAIPDEESRAQLLREARTASALNHPNLCTIYDVGEADGGVYIVMEFVSGKPLAALIPADGLPSALVIRYGAQIADALEHAHAHGIIHRDLKTSNVMITPEGRPKVLDFGLARHQRVNVLDAATRSMASLEDAGPIAGTLHYMAPEILRGKPASAQSDIWSLGVLLYEAAAGHKPFQGNTGFELSSAILRASPPPFRPEVPTGLATVVDRCLEKEPAQRYQHAAEARAALEAIGSSSANLSAAVPPAAAHPTGSPASAGAESKPSRKRRSLILTALLGAAVILGAGMLVAPLAQRAWRKLRPGGSAATSIGSIAVLPLANLSNDPSQEYFADGMTEAVINDLSRIRALRVISRTSVMQYKNAHKPLPQIALELHVEGVVEGSVLREGNRVRINAQLVQARDDRTLWSDSYERDLSDVLSLQAEVAQAVASEIQVQLSPEEHSRLAHQRTVNPDAYQDYLKGRFYLAQRTPEALVKGREFFEQAIASDPSYAAAYGGLADAYSLLEDYRVLPAREAMPLAMANVRKALSLDDSLAEAYTSLAQILGTDKWDWAGAEKAFQRAIALDPGSANAHHWYALHLAAMGRSEQALAEIKRAQELDPLSPIINDNIAWCDYLARNYAAAIEQLQKTQELFPSFSAGSEYLAQTLLADGRNAEALAVLEKVSAGGDRSVDWLLGYAEAKTGHREKALDIYHSLEQKSRQRDIDAYSLAIVATGLGEKEQALQWLEKSAEGRDGRLVNLRVHPMFDPLRTDPRFQALLRRMGLAP